MISYDRLLLHNKQKWKDVLMTMISVLMTMISLWLKLTENIRAGRKMKNHKRLIRIFHSLILLPHNFVTTHYWFSLYILCEKDVSWFDWLDIPWIHPYNSSTVTACCFSHTFVKCLQFQSSCKHDTRPRRKLC